VFLQLEGLGVAKKLSLSSLTISEISHKSHFLIDVKATRKPQTGNAYKILFWGDLEVENVMLKEIINVWGMNVWTGFS